MLEARFGTSCYPTPARMSSRSNPGERTETWQVADAVFGLAAACGTPIEASQWGKYGPDRPSKGDPGSSRQDNASCLLVRGCL